LCRETGGENFNGLIKRRETERGTKTVSAFPAASAGSVFLEGTERIAPEVRGVYARYQRVRRFHHGGKLSARGFVDQVRSEVAGPGCVGAASADTRSGTGCADGCADGPDDERFCRTQYAQVRAGKTNGLERFERRESVERHNRMQCPGNRVAARARVQVRQSLNGTERAKLYP